MIFYFVFRYLWMESISLEVESDIICDEESIYEYIASLYKFNTNLNHKGVSYRYTF